MACDKHSYKGRASARKGLKAMKGFAYDTRGLHVYFCRECSAYHVGHAWQTGRVKV